MRNTIYSTARSTRGVRAQEATSQSGFVAFIKKAFGDLPWYEYLWYCIFIVVGILCLALLKFTPTLLITVLSLYVYMVASNLTARGKLGGLIVATFSSTVYVVVCFFTRVWGEVIANILIYIPLNIYAIFKWKSLKSQNDNHENTLAVTKMSFNDWWFYLSFIGVGGLGLGLFLQEVMHQNWAILNAFSIFISLGGDFARNNGKREVWWFYLVSNILFFTMWVLVSSGDGWDTIPYSISAVASIFNSIIGMIEWQKLLQKNQLTTGYYLSHNRPKINSIVRLRRQMQHFVWKSECDANWQNRHQNYQTIKPTHTSNAIITAYKRK